MDDFIIKLSRFLFKFLSFSYCSQTGFSLVYFISSWLQHMHACLGFIILTLANADNLLLRMNRSEDAFLLK